MHFHSDRTRKKISGASGLRLAILALMLYSLFSPLLLVFGQTLPTTFTTNITVGGSTRTVHFTAHPIRSANFAVKVQQADGSWAPFNPGPPSTYLGTVLGEPGALACGTLLTNGHFWARIGFENGVEWVYFSGPNTRAYSRGVVDTAIKYPTSPVVTANGGAGPNVYAAEIAVDSGWNHFNACGQNFYLTVMSVEHSILSGNNVFLRDNGILHRIGAVFIRADYGQDPYHSISAAGGKLEACRVFLNANSTTHDVGTVADSIGGGVAWVGVIGTGVRYSACGFNGNENGDFSQVWRHEVGHNWGSLDYEGGGSEGKTIMNGNALGRFSGPEQNKIVNHRNAKLGILDNLGPYSFPLPPCASMDVAAMYYPGSVTLDVLRNDHSGNGLAISLLTTNAASTRGGTITRSFGTGPNGRDQLVYEPPAGSPIGTDKFSYRITDSEGRTGVGYVYVIVNPPVGSPNPANLAGNVPPSQDLSWTTHKPGSSYDIYLGTDRTAVVTATTTSAAYQGRQADLLLDPGLLASSQTYYWRVDVITDGVITTGSIWQFTTADSPLTANLLVHLTMDSADLTGQNLETVLDVAYPANNFVNSGADHDQPGRIGQALLFNGTNSSVISGTTDIIPASPSGTLSAWIKATNTASGAYLVSVEGAWVLRYDGGKLVAFLDGSSSGNPTLNTTLNDGAWHHVAAANDGATTRVYVDGALVGTYAETINNLGSLSRQTGVGANYDGAGNYFEGSVDEVCIWAHGLAASEIYWVYTNGLAGKLIEREKLLVRTGFEPWQGFTGYTSPNFAPLGTKTDNLAVVWQGLSGDVQIWNRSDIPPSGVQCLKLGDADAQCRIRIPGTTHGVATVIFDYSTFSTTSDCDFSLFYSNATSGGWVQVWSTHVSGEPWWEDKPWPTVQVPIFATGDVDLLLKKTGVKGVLVDHFRVTSKYLFPPEFAANPVIKPNATAGLIYSETLAQAVFDTLVNSGLVFQKISGPAWLTVSSEGALSGIPSSSDFGYNEFAVRVTDSSGQSGETLLAIYVDVDASSLMAGAQPNPAYTQFWSWFTADDEASINGPGIDGDGAVVTRWNDVRGASDHDLARATGGGGGTFRMNRVNGLPAVNYTGTRGNWGAYNAQGEFQLIPNGYTIFVVARVNSLAATGYLFDGASGFGRIGLRASIGSPNRWQLQAFRNWNGQPSMDATTVTATVEVGKFQVHAVTVAGNTMSHYVDGAFAGSSTFNDGGVPLPMSGLILSCNASVANHLECDIAEVLAYSSVITAPDRTAVEKYLLGKYGLVLPPPEVPVFSASTSGGNLLMSVPSQSGYTYVLESTPDLANPIWTGVATNSGTGTPIEFSAPVDPAQPLRYYRIMAF